MSVSVGLAYTVQISGRRDPQFPPVSVCRDEVLQVQAQLKGALWFPIKCGNQPRKGFFARNGSLSSSRTKFGQFPSPSFFGSRSGIDSLAFRRCSSTRSLSGTGKTTRRGVQASATMSWISGPAVSKAIIVGGGLGGLLTAVALRKVGIDAQVYEKTAARIETPGTMISIFPNGMKALAAIEPAIAEKIKERGALCSHTVALTLDGCQLAETPSPSPAKYGQPMVCIRWSRILDTFQEFLPEDCIHTGFTFMGKVLQDNEDHVTAVFEREGQEVLVQAPLLIGADGIRSRLRAAVLGEEDVAPRDNGRAVWRLIVPDGEVEHEMVKKLRSTFAIGDGKTFVVSDPGEGNVYFALTCTDEASGGVTKIRSGSPEECKARLLEVFKDVPFLLPIIEQFDADKILERRVVDLPPLPSWRKGRILLIGDAAHAVTPTMGQGANLAFEDALELSRQMAAHSSLDEALEEYLQLRGPRVETIVQTNQASAARSYQKRPGNVASTTADIQEYMYNYERLEEPLKMPSVMAA